MIILFLLYSFIPIPVEADCQNYRVVEAAGTRRFGMAARLAGNVYSFIPIPVEADCQSYRVVEAAETLEGSVWQLG